MQHPGRRVVPISDLELRIGMKKTLCLSLMKRSADECSKAMASSDADMIEHRLDFMNRIEGLSAIYNESKVPIIATCRTPRNGGQYAGDEASRIGHLVEAILAGASFVDIELDTDPTLMNMMRNAAAENDSKLIVSKHYFDSTPEISELRSVLDSLVIVGADIMKLVTTANTIDDCGKILHLYHIKSRPARPMIAFAMGDLGRFTRLTALYLGAPFMYVSQDQGKQAASGQITLSEMRALLEVLK
ncbi:MAG: type I 3-dehydroquinate dehydratase [Candidatus Thorarchaeota archaeon]